MGRRSCANTNRHPWVVSSANCRRLASILSLLSADRPLLEATMSPRLAIIWGQSSSSVEASSLLRLNGACDALERVHAAPSGGPDRDRRAGSASRGLRHLKAAMTNTKRERPVTPGRSLHVGAARDLERRDATPSGKGLELTYEPTNFLRRGSPSLRRSRASASPDRRKRRQCGDWAGAQPRGKRSPHVLAHGGSGEGSPARAR